MGIKKESLPWLSFFAFLMTKTVAAARGGGRKEKA